MSHDAIRAEPRLPAEPSRSDVNGWSSWQRERLNGIEAAFAGAALLARPQLMDALNGAARQAVATGTNAAAILIDINNFSDINASWGPAVGDQAIAALGERIAAYAAGPLTRALPQPAKAGYLDGDHFVVIAPLAPSIEGIRLNTIELLRHLAQPFEIAGQTLVLSARAVVMQVPLHGRSVTTILGRGFRLLNSTARLASDGVALSEANDSQAASNLLLERDIAAALSTDQLFIMLQPKIEIATGLVKGAEALVRFQHPERGLLPPPVVIEAAEKSGLIFELGLRILRDACRASKELNASGPPVNIAVNVSPHQLAHPDFLSRFLEVIDREGVEPQRLEIEVTETAAMMGGERIAASLQSLRRCGISLAIDDFGTGFSNLASLSALPADTLKIDRSLVTGGDQGGKAAALLDIAVKLGRTFGMVTIAEGVETTSQYQHVSELGCDLVQGYFTGRPVRVGDFARTYLPGAS
jgi:diguanylate cyclase